MKKMLMLIASLIAAITLVTGTVQNAEDVKQDKVTEQAGTFTTDGVGDGW
jgi:ABC-type Fe3+-citrate transport system substrate-binding protein